MGRPRKKGARLPTLQAVIDNPKTQLKRVSVSRIGMSNRSGRSNWRAVNVTGLTQGKEAVPIRWMLIRDPREKFEPQALLKISDAFLCRSVYHDYLFVIGLPSLYSIKPRKRYRNV